GAGGVDRPATRGIKFFTGWRDNRARLGDNIRGEGFFVDRLTEGRSIMKGARTRAVSRHDAGWLERENPAVHYMIRTMEGDDQACRWLEGQSRGLCLFTRAITGDKKALASLKARDGLELDDLFAIIGTSDLPDWFQERHPDLHDLFAAIRGDDAAFWRLKKNSPLGKVAQIVRHQARADPPATPPAARLVHPDPVSESIAA